MIRNLSPEEKEEWDRQVQHHLDRVSRPRFTERTVVLIIILVVILMGRIGTCATLTWHPQSSQTAPAADSTLENHSGIPDSVEAAATSSITAYTDSLLRTDSILHPHPGQWTIDSITAYIYKMARCRELEDSERDMALQVALGRASQRTYDSAYMVYSDYYKNVYEPAFRRLSAHCTDSSLTSGAFYH